MTFAPPKIPTTYCWYDTLDKDLNKLWGRREAACYSDLTTWEEGDKEDGIDIEVIKFVRTWIDTKYSPYDEVFVKDWIKEVQGFGFDCDYEGLKDNSYYFLIPIDINIDPIKRKMLGTFMCIRYLWENGLYSIPFHYFKAKEELPDLDKITTLQVAHYAAQVNTDYGNFYGHTLFGDNITTFADSDKLKRVLEAHSNKDEKGKARFEGDQYPYLSLAMEGNFITSRATQFKGFSHKEIYEWVKNYKKVKV